MARKMSEQARMKAFDRKVASFTKSQAKKWVNNGAKAPRPSRKSKQADADAATVVIGLAVVGLIYQAATSAIDKVKGK